ncbi:peptidoglycan editing factor PgeF [Pseudoxanthomonas sp. LH2527]|uniref:peptidoglycan editing factor PgeF n=1 Tax=Pseudoxanthomonas sp. LH2527 TaxID=2923249 RepID=UPI001F137E57|nr:peptidoglycan editing factor PgeF [Pseudoxanthomonas sp. LH2527]MCH6482995.1 peptidoglycan editing factor PgeF [Pseudoxanthomonas sp. LH2527]
MNRAPAVLADWPAPAGVHAFTTLRHGAGFSAAPFDVFNLGNRFAADGDDPAVVARNRAQLVELAGLPSPPHWLKQVHGTDVLRVETPADPDATEPVADALVTSTPGVVLAILTADCLPVVFAAKDGREVAAAHAGWPGLSKGMLEATLAAMATPASDLVAWIGPAAGPARYEVGRDVFDVFVAHDAGAEACFVPTRAGHWLADLPALARRRLVARGMAPADIHGGDLCTISEPARFFSHRRDGRSGRIATLAWMQP